MKLKVCAVTSTRADYNLLLPTLKKINSDPSCELQLIVTGSHLMDSHGYTVSIIEKDFPNHYPINLKNYSDNINQITKIMGQEIIDFTELLNKLNPTYMLLLGDRYEILAPAIVATMRNIPIFHMCGGDITIGAYDNYIRDMITIMSSVHFPTNKVALDRIQNFQKKNIYLAGHPCLEYINELSFKSKSQLQDELSIGLNSDSTTNININILVGYHPETLSDNINRDTDTIIEFINTINKNNNLNIFLIGTNIDNNSDYINQSFKKLSENNHNIHFFMSLDQLTYFSLAKLCNIYIGNSSSSVYELPYLMKNIILVGNRQKGRLLASNIIECPIDLDGLVSCYNSVLKNNNTENVNYKYLSYNTSEMVSNIILNYKKIIH